MASDETLLLVLMAGLGGWVAWLLVRRQQIGTQARLQRADSFNRLLEKFGTAKEFVDFLNTEQGNKLLEDPLPQHTNGRKVALRFVQVGIVLAALGVAITLNWIRMADYVHAQSNPDINWIHKEWDYYYWWVLSLSLSAGMFIIAFVTNILVKRWHLNGNGADTIRH